MIWTVDHKDSAFLFLLSKFSYNETVKHILLICTLVIVAQSAHAQRFSRSDAGSVSTDSTTPEFLLNVNFFSLGDAQNLSVSRKRFDLLYQLMLGLKYKNWLFAVQYDSDLEKNEYTDINGATQYRWQRKAVGPSLGYYFGPVFLYGTYYINPSLTSSISGSTETEYKGKSGYALTAGYHYRFHAHFALGLQLTYRAFQFEESNVNGTTTNLTDYNISSLDPMASMFLYF